VDDPVKTEVNSFYHLEDSKALEFCLPADIHFNYKAYSRRSHTERFG
jgi:hypothetical protein